MSELPDDRAGALVAIRNATVFLAVVVAMVLARYFQGIITPLVVAVFLLLLIEALARVLRQRLPNAPRWVRGRLAGGIILVTFVAIGVLFAIEAPPFAGTVRGMTPKLDALLANSLEMVGAPPMRLHQLLGGIEPAKLLAQVFTAARGLISYSVLVMIYFGFLLASRAAFGRKLDILYQDDGQRRSAGRVAQSVRDAVERYVRLQTLKAFLVTVVAWGIMVLMGVHDALFVAFVVFLSAYVPIVGPTIGAAFPALAAFAQFDDPLRPGILLAVVGGAAFVIDNVLMPKLASDELNIDPLLVLISIGFWGSILGAPGVLLSTPLTVMLMAVAAEFENTRWLAVLLSRDGQLSHHAETDEDSGKAL